MKERPVSSLLLLLLCRLFFSVRQGSLLFSYVVQKRRFLVAQGRVGKGQAVSSGFRASSEESLFARFFFFLNRRFLLFSFSYPSWVLFNAATRRRQGLLYLVRFRFLLSAPHQQK